MSRENFDMIDRDEMPEEPNENQDEREDDPDFMSDRARVFRKWEMVLKDAPTIIQTLLEAENKTMESKQMIDISMERYGPDVVLEINDDLHENERIDEDTYKLIAKQAKARAGFRS